MANGGQVAFFALLGAVCTVTLATTLWQHPLLEWKLSDVRWLNAWLGMTVLDYYGAVLPLCAIALSSQTELTSGLAWSAGFIFGGSPFCCAYVLYRLLYFPPEDALRLCARYR